jgi:uncharacterized protein YicC (UPF0701 family)
MIRKNGLFSTGGRYADWKVKGKTWKTAKDAQKAINYHNRDEEVWRKDQREDMVEEIARLEKYLLKGRLTLKSKEFTKKEKESMVREIARMKKFLKTKGTPSFYRGAKIIEIKCSEV